jgi:hypothetical protein
LFAGPSVSRSSCAAAAEPASGNDPPVARKPERELVPTAAAAKLFSPPKPDAGERRTDRRPDRLRAALGKLPVSFSTTMAAPAAGLSNGKTPARLQHLERRGEVQRVGNRWSTVADGYHRVSASHLLDESTPVPCVLVSVP